MGEKLEIILKAYLSQLFNITNFRIDDILSLNELIKLISNINTNIVLTGRGAKSQLIEIADLVTEMNFIKHPYEKGIEATEGIEY